MSFDTVQTKRGLIVVHILVVKIKRRQNKIYLVKVTKSLDEVVGGVGDFLGRNCLEEK